MLCVKGVPTKTGCNFQLKVYFLADSNCYSAQTAFCTFVGHLCVREGTSSSPQKRAAIFN